MILSTIITNITNKKQLYSKPSEKKRVSKFDSNFLDFFLIQKINFGFILDFVFDF